MITVNNAILSEILSPVREVYARVELYEGSTLISTFNPTDRLIKFNVQRVGDTGKFFGFGICQKLNFHLIDKDRELNLTTANSVRVSYTVDKVNYVYPHPTFYITEVHRDENTNEISVTAYDLLKTADKLTIDDLGLTAPYTLIQFMNKAANKIVKSDISLVNFVDSTPPYQVNFAEGGNLEGTEVVRDILDDAAEFTQSIYYIDCYDRLVFKRLDKNGAAAFTIAKDHYITLKSKSNRRLKSLCRATELGDNITATMDISGTTQYMRDNVFYDVLDGTKIADLLNDAILLMGGLTINQFDCSWRGNFFLEIGDKIGLVNKEGETVYSYIFDDTITYNGSLSEQTSWEYTTADDEVSSNPSTIGDKLNKTYAKVDKINKEIELLASKIGDSDTGVLAEEVAQLKITTESITQEVSRVEQSTSDAINTISNIVTNSVSAEDVKILVKQEITEGVDIDANSITTETGFTFNKDGLLISKSGSELTTQITEDGMTVRRGTQTVLSADSDGVYATNLHATTYLIIGETSRFEDYENGARTGCFWTGR